jgi:hypothetical protein
MLGGMRGEYRLGRCRGLAAAVAAGLVLAGCSSLSMPSVSSLFGPSTPPSAATPAGATPEATDIECPSVTVRQGASTFAQYVNPVEPSALTLRYQASLGQSARECRVAGGFVTMRVGVEGRVIVGPAGSPNVIDVPVRMAVVKEGIEPRPIVTKLQRIPITVPPGEPHVAFTHIEEQLVFPLPPPGDIDAYIVYIGFDPLAAREPPPRRPAKPAPKPKRGA